MISQNCNKVSQTFTSQVLFWLQKIDLFCFIEMISFLELHSNCFFFFQKTAINKSCFILTITKAISFQLQRCEVRSIGKKRTLFQHLNAIFISCLFQRDLDLPFEIVLHAPDIHDKRRFKSFKDIKNRKKI